MTLAFWIAAAAVTVLTLVALIVPLVRKPAGADAARAEFDLTVYKDQLAEVDRDLERGVLSEDQALAARTEIERRMLAATSGDDDGAPAARSPRLSGALIAVLAIALPLGAAGLYYSVGNPGLGDHPLAERRAQSAEQTAQTNDRQAQLRAMVQDIEGRTEQDPGNPRNWAVLGQAYQMMGRFDESVTAYRKLVEVTDRHPEALVMLAEAMFVAADETVTPEAEKLFLESRTQDPANPMTYYYVALARQQTGDLQGAIDEYAGLLAVSPENAEWVPNIQERMKAVADELGVEVPVVQMLPPMEMAPAPVAPGPTAEQIQEAQQMTAEDQQAMIRSMVDQLAGRLKDNPDDLAGWQRLAQAYRVLGDETGLAEAEANIERLQGGQ